MIRFRLFFLALAVALVAAACGGATQGVDTATAADADSDVSDAPASPSQAAAPAPAEAVAEEAVVEAAPASELFGTFETIGAGQLDFGTLEGQDVVLWFWAPW